MARKKDEFKIKVKFEQKHALALAIGLFILILDILFLRPTTFFAPLIIISLSISWLPYWIDYFVEIQRQKSIENTFPDYVRNLVGAVKSGMPISKAIVYVSASDYGPLNKYVKKMANQIEWGLSVQRVFKTFSNDTRNPIIARAISTVMEAEKSGGKIEDVLSSITNSLIAIKRIRQERKAAIQSQVTQSYIIFFVFLGVLVTIQNLLIPYMAKMETTDVAGTGVSGTAINALISPVKFDFTNLFTFIGSALSWFVSMQGVFTMLALVQAFFAGIVLGKFSDGDFKSGFRHSFIMMTLSMIVMSFANSIASSVAL